MTERSARRPTEQAASPATVREAVALFQDLDELQDAVEELQFSGFNRADIGIMAPRPRVEAHLGRAYVDVRELLEEPGIPTVPFMSSHPLTVARGVAIGLPAYLLFAIGSALTVALGGDLAAVVIFGTLWGLTGAVIGLGIAQLVVRRRARWFEEQLASGGILVWVRTVDPVREDNAVRVLTRHQAEGVHVHEVAAA